MKRLLDEGSCPEVFPLHTPSEYSELVTETTPQTLWLSVGDPVLCSDLYAARFLVCFLLLIYLDYIGFVLKRNFCSSIWKDHKLFQMFLCLRRTGYWSMRQPHPKTGTNEDQTTTTITLIVSNQATRSIWYTCSSYVAKIECTQIFIHSLTETSNLLNTSKIVD